jgi:hypothetical protein
VIYPPGLSPRSYWVEIPPLPTNGPATRVVSISFKDGVIEETWSANRKDVEVGIMDVKTRQSCKDPIGTAGKKPRIAMPPAGRGPNPARRSGMIPAAS